MTAGLGLLGAEGRPEAVDLAEGHGIRLVVELARLRQVRFLIVEVIDFEQRGGAFAGGGREYRRIDQRKAVIIEIIAHRFDDFVANPNNGVLPLRAKPEMAVVHQEFDAVVLGRDGVGVGLRNLLQDFDGFDIHLIAAGGARFGADLAAHHERRFLREVLQTFESLFRQVVLHGHALHEAGAIAQDGEDDLAGLAEVVEPARDFYGFALVAGGVGNGDSGHRFSSLSKTAFISPRGLAMSETSRNSSNSGYWPGFERSSSMVLRQSTVPPSAMGKRC